MATRVTCSLSEVTNERGITLYHWNMTADHGEGDLRHIAQSCTPMDKAEAIEAVKYVVAHAHECVRIVVPGTMKDIELST